MNDDTCKSCRNDYADHEGLCWSCVEHAEYCQELDGDLNERTFDE